MPASNICRQTKLIKSRNRLPGSVCRQTKRGKSKYVCQVQVVSADRINKNKKMSASHHLSRQTKQEKRSKCLPVPQLVADKSKEIWIMSASHKLSRQTKQEKRSKCLPVPQFGGRQKQGNPENVCQAPIKSADKTREKKQMSASPTIWWQIKARKSGKCLPVSQFAGRQSQENQENICQLQNLPADRIKKL